MCGNIGRSPTARLGCPARVTGKPHMARPQRAALRDATGGPQCRRIVHPCGLSRPTGRRRDVHKPRGGGGAGSCGFQPCTQHCLVFERTTRIAQPRRTRTRGSSTRARASCAGCRASAAVSNVVTVVAVAIWLCCAAVAGRVDANTAASASAGGNVGRVGLPTRVQQRIQTNAARGVGSDAHARVAAQRHGIVVLCVVSSAASDCRIIIIIVYCEGY